MTPVPPNWLHLAAPEFELRKERDTGQNSLHDEYWSWCLLSVEYSKWWIFLLVVILSGILYRSCQGFFTYIWTNTGDAFVPGLLWLHLWSLWFSMVHPLWESPCPTLHLSGIPFIMTSLVSFHWVFGRYSENSHGFVKFCHQNCSCF